MSNYFITSPDTYILPYGRHTCGDGEEERNAADIRKENKYLVFESCLLQLLKWCCNCGQEVELNIKGTLLTVLTVRVPVQRETCT